MEKVYIYDTTLRDGAQGEGISFSDTAKVRFAHLLDEFGVDFIEGGFAGSNPRDRRFFDDIRKERLAHARVTAFGSTRRVDVDAQGDPQLAGLLAAETEWVTIYGKSWLLHVRDVLRTTGENNLQMIADTVGFLRAAGRRVLFDAEHFFDGYKDDPAYALGALQAALREGADGVVLCDTNGGCLPHEIFAITQTVCAALPGAQVGIHTHNDSGLAVAASLEAVRAGAGAAIGSRLIPGARVTDRSLSREVSSRGYNLCLWLFFQAPFRDAQCGFKAVSRSVRDRFLPLTRDSHWFFDSELLLLAGRGGCRVREIPVCWRDDQVRDSKVRLIRDIVYFIRRIIELRRRLWFDAELRDRLRP